MELFDNLSLSHLTNEYFAMILSTAYFPVFLPPSKMQILMFLAHNTHPFHVFEGNACPIKPDPL